MTVVKVSLWTNLILDQVAYYRISRNMINYTFEKYYISKYYQKVQMGRIKKRELQEIYLRVKYLHVLMR